MQIRSFPIPVTVKPYIVLLYYFRKMGRIESSWTHATAIALLLVLLYPTKCLCEDDTDPKALLQVEGRSVR